MPMSNFTNLVETNSSSATNFLESMHDGHLRFILEKWSYDHLESE